MQLKSKAKNKWWKTNARNISCSFNNVILIRMTYLRLRYFSPELNLNNWPVTMKLQSTQTHTHTHAHSTFIRFESLTNDCFPLIHCVKVFKRCNEVANCTSFAPENRLSFIVRVSFQNSFTVNGICSRQCFNDYSATPPVYFIQWRCIGIECPVILTCKALNIWVCCTLYIKFKIQTTSLRPFVYFYFSPIFNWLVIEWTNEVNEHESFAR